MPLTKKGEKIKSAMELSELDKAYIAGIIDGEGCITAATDIRVNGVMKLRECLIIAMTDIEFVKGLYYLMGKRGTLRIINKEGTKNKDVARIDIRCNEAREIISLIRPYLKIKGKQADLVMSIPHSKGKGYYLTQSQLEKHKEIKVILSQLHQRGRQSIYAKIS